MSDSIRSQLSPIHIFAGLDDAVMDSLAAACHERHVATDEIIMEEGAVAHEMFVISRGKVEVLKHLGGPGEIVLATLGPGEFFGEMCILECMPRAATVRALEPTELCSLQNGDLLRLFSRWPDQYAILMLNIARDLCRRLRKMHDLLYSALQPGATPARIEPEDKSIRVV